MSLGEGKKARGEPDSRYKAQNWTPRAPGPTPEAPLPRQGPLLPAPLSATGAETEKFPHAPLWILNNNKKPHRSGRGSRCRAPAPTASRARRRLPADCGGEPLLTAAAPDSSGRGSNSNSSSGVGQQRREEEVLRSRLASRSAAISAPRAAAAAAATAPRSARALPSARLSRSLRRRLGSSPAQPGQPARPPRAPKGKDSGTPPSCSGEERRAEKGSQYIPGESCGGGSVSPGSRRRHPPPTRAPHRRARGAETAGWGAGAGARRAAHAHSRARAPPLPAGSVFAPRGLPGSNPGGRFAGSRGGGAELAQGQAAGPLPSPTLCSPEPGTGAERARRALLLLASGKPRRSDPPPVLPPPAPNPRERFPLTSAGSFKGCGDLRQSREPARTSLLRASI